MATEAYLLRLGVTPYREALALQQALAGALAEARIPETVVLLEHAPVITVGRTTDEERELHLPDGVDVEVVETNRGGKSTYHGPGQLVCYPILDLNRHGRDVRRYVRDLEQALVLTLEAFALRATTLEGLTGVWMPPGGGQGPRKIASIGVRVSRWVTTHGAALNVALDPAPFTQWITACGLEEAAFTTMAIELGQAPPLPAVSDAAAAALAETYALSFVEIAPADLPELLPAAAVPAAG